MACMIDRDHHPAFFIDQPDPGHSELARLYDDMADIPEESFGAVGVYDSFIDLADRGVQPAGFQYLLLCVFPFGDIGEINGYPVGRRIDMNFKMSLGGFIKTFKVMVSLFLPG